VALPRDPNQRDYQDARPDAHSCFGGRGHQPQPYL